MSGELLLNCVPMSYPRPQRIFVNFVLERQALDLREVLSIGKQRKGSLQS